MRASRTWVRSGVSFGWSRIRSWNVRWASVNPRRIVRRARAPSSFPRSSSVMACSSGRVRPLRVNSRFRRTSIFRVFRAFAIGSHPSAALALLPALGSGEPADLRAGPRAGRDRARPPDVLVRAAAERVVDRVHGHPPDVERGLRQGVVGVDLLAGLDDRPLEPPAAGDGPDLGPAGAEEDLEDAAGELDRHLAAGMGDHEGAGAGGPHQAAAIEWIDLDVG